MSKDVRICSYISRTKGVRKQTIWVTVANSSSILLYITELYEIN